MRVIDVANVAAPIEVGSYSSLGWYARHVAVAGNHAYVTGSTTDSDALRVLDISNPAAPFEVGSANLDAGDVVVDGGYIYVGGGTSGLFILRFTGDSHTYTISGRVTDASGAGIPGVTVWAGFPRNTTTDANGYYTFAGLPAGTYTIRPERSGESYFVPPVSTITLPSDSADT